MSDRHFVKTHKCKTVQGNAGAYERYVEANPVNKQKGKLGDRFDFTTEDARANPDSVRTDEAMYADSQPSNPHMLLGEAINHLQGRQKECYLLTMRYGKSFSEAAEILGIGKGRVQQYRERAIKFLTQYCENAIKAGRV